MQLQRPLLTLFFVISIGGCALFTPPYDAYLDERTASAYEAIAKIAAGAELGQYSDPTSFEKASNQYVDIHARLSVAALRAETLPAASSLSKDARKVMAGQIKSCRDQVGSLANLHKEEGIQPNAGATTAMMASCDMAVRTVQALKN